MKNENQTTHTSQPSNWQKLQKSSILKLSVIGLLILIMLIPLNMVTSLIKERQNRKTEATQQIQEKWGGSVMFSGPILKIPYRSSYRDKKGNARIYQPKGQFIYLFPESENIDSKVEASFKNYGIYKASIFKSENKIEGVFNPDYLKGIAVALNLIDWSQSKILFGVSSLKGVGSAIEIKVKDKTLNVSNSSINQISGYTHDDKTGEVSGGLHYLETEAFDLNTENESFAFQMNFILNGSSNIRFIPLAQETKVNLNSEWNSLSHFGYFLPQQTIKDGKVSEAKWAIMGMNRAIPKAKLDLLPNYGSYSFGTSFIETVDDYQKNERTSKYGMLVIGLTFLVFFLIQMTSGQYVHPFQYLLIGFALALFYVLLLSISEHLGFNTAYVSAATAVALLITLFSRSLFSKWSLPIFIGGALVTLYTFLFAIIQLEQYTLLAGSIGLFIILALVMYFSRKINWNN